MTQQLLLKRTAVKNLLFKETHEESVDKLLFSMESSISNLFNAIIFGNLSI